MVAGVPLVACGGRLITESAADAGDDSAASTATAVPGTTASGSGTSTSTPPASGSSQQPFGNFPCTAYTAWYYSCPPSAGTSGCKYDSPIDGNPADGWTDSTTQSEAPGCRLEIVAPTDVGGSTCETLASCICDAPSTWSAYQGSGYCPNN